MFLTLENLTKTFGDKTAVRSLSLQLEQGELLCLLGPSGCGKTTTLNLIGGFLAPDSGSVTLDGESLTALPPERRPVATVFQSYALFPHMTVLQNVTYPLKVRRCPRGEMQTRGMALLNMVGLGEEAKSSVAALSGGEKQRVALVRALAADPKVLLLDEPLSNLDAPLRLRLQQELKKIQQELGTTMILVTHDREEALLLADRIAIMDGGALLQVGTPESLREHPCCDTVRRFLDPDSLSLCGEGGT